MNHHVIVYGTLKRGYGNHSRLLSAEFLGEVRVPRFTLYAVASFPGALPDEEGCVEGELYAVDDRTLARLDALEGYRPGHPVRSMYLRREVETDDGQTAWMYIWNEPDVDESLRLGPLWPAPGSCERCRQLGGHSPFCPRRPGCVACGAGEGEECSPECYRAATREVL